jgi:Ca2+-binding EF-hand superfamily protein
MAMKTRLTAVVAFAIGLVLVFGPAASAQYRDRDRDDDRREDRDRDRGRDGGRDFDPREIIRQADDNNDGMIDPSEVGQRSGYYIRRAAERAGLDASKPLRADQILPALEAMRAENNNSNSNSSSSSTSSSSRPAATPAVNGFGAPAPGAAPAVQGFNVPLTASAGTGLEKRFDQRVIDYVNEMIRERDVNKNGVLEKTEWTGRWSTPPEESDTNKDNVLDKEELCVRIAKRIGNSAGSQPGSTTTSASSGTPGGGSTPYGQRPGYGSSPSSGSPPGSSSDNQERYRRYAEGMIRQYDRNRDGKLDKDESSQMRPEHLAADVNKDTIITQDELQNRLQSYAGGSSSGGSSSGDGGRGYGSRGSSSDNKTAAAPKRSFRITPPTERLPKGLPDWFLRGDADGDGQVSMSEYTSTWTEQLAAEFLKYDANGDGIITPAECQAASGGRR